MKFAFLILLFSLSFDQVISQTLNKDNSSFQSGSFTQQSVAVERNDFPYLVLDSTITEFWGYIGNKFDVTEKGLKKFENNAADLPVKITEYKTSYYNGFPQIKLDTTILVYDLENRILSQQKLTVDNLGNFSGGLLYEYTYTTPGQTNYVLIISVKNYATAFWQPFNRKTTTSNDTSRVDLLEFWDTAAGEYIPHSRYTNTYDAEGNELTNLSEIWDMVNWKAASFWEKTYNEEGNIISNQTSNLNLSGNLIPALRFEYEYDNFGRRWKQYSFVWDTLEGDFLLSSQSENQYNNENEVIQIETFTALPSGVLENSSRILYSYGPGIYTDLAEETILQQWDTVTLNYVNSGLSRLVYADIPGDRVLLEHEYSDKAPLSPEEWRRNTYWQNFYTKSPQSGILTTSLEAACKVPNPYQTGTQVICDFLDTNTSYMLQVFDLSGGTMYTRYFKGCDGWSIRKNLPAGMYVAVITRNDKLVANWKLVIAQ